MHIFERTFAVFGLKMSVPKTGEALGEDKLPAGPPSYYYTLEAMMALEIDIIAKGEAIGGIGREGREHWGRRKREVKEP